MALDNVHLTDSYPKLTIFIRRARGAITGRPYFFNRQKLRLRVFREINQLIPFDNYIETGAYLGLTTHFLGTIARTRGASVHSCEINDYYYSIACRTAGDLENVQLHHENSVDFLKSLSLRIMKAVNFVYLDAHWNTYLPLRDELGVLTNWSNSVVMVDDFKVPFDEGFGWDKYDNEREICMRYIEDSIGTNAVYFPNYSAAEEGVGIARGYCVIPMSEHIANILDGVRLLRRHNG